MARRVTENALNNSYQIKEEFKSKDIKRCLYKPYKLRYSAKGRSGRVTCFTEEQIFLYKIRWCSSVVKG